jgi:hypothetical protein
MRSLRPLAVAVLAVILALSVGIGFVPSSTAEECQEVPLDVCVVQFGVEANGAVTWLPGYADLGVPISQCQNKTDVLGQDALDRTILTSEFNHYQICPTGTGTIGTTTATATIETTIETTTATTTLSSSTIPEFRSVLLTMVVAVLVIAILRRKER